VYGDHDQADTYLAQASGLFRGMGDQGGEAYTLTGVGLVALQRGDYQFAYQSAVQVLATMRAFDEQHIQLWSLTSVGQALTALDHVLLALARYEEAVVAFQEAIQSPTLKFAALVIEAQSGLVAALFAQGERDAALTHIEKVLDYLAVHSLDGTLTPLRIYRDCYNVLRATDDARARLLLEQAHRQLMAHTSNLDAQSQHSFFSNVPWHGELAATLS
jgi:tetratricopeptide (TPR) repeat protein